MERKASVKTLKRTATWIDKSLNLRAVLKEPRALKAFQDFAASIKAEENVSFWVAVEFFRVQHISTPKTGEKMRKRFSEALKTPLPSLESEALFHMDPRHSVMMDQLMTQDKLAQLDLSESQLALLIDASRIFRVFLEDSGPHWTFVEPHIVDEIRNHIKAGDVDINIFAKAQSFAYVTMNRDIFPRFVKAIIDNPQKYSTADTFELPRETLEQLEKLTV